MVKSPELSDVTDRAKCCTKEGDKAKCSGRGVREGRVREMEEEEEQQQGWWEKK